LKKQKQIEKMKQIKLNKLTMRHFKGATSLNIDFTDITNIEGDNGTGKTTVFDAFNWLLWGKNSANESTFEIKTLNDDNEPIHNLEHEVFGIIKSGDNTFELKRVYRESWVKKRGSDVAVFNGHSTALFIDDVPYSATDYKAVINKIIPDNIARMITDPQYFNVHLKWNERRLILSEIAGEISDDYILSLNPDLDELPKILSSGKSLIDKKKETNSKKTKIKTELDFIPARIDEVERSIPEVKDWEKIESYIEIKQKTLEENQKLIDSKQEQQNKEFESVKEINEKKNKLEIDLESEKNNIILEANKEKNKIEQCKSSLINELEVLRSDLKTKESNIPSKKLRIDQLRKGNADLRKQYDEVNGAPITSETDEKCNSCGQMLSKDVVESKKAEILEKANKDRVERLNRLSNLGKENNTEIQRLQGELSTLEAKIIESNESIKLKESELNKIVVPEVYGPAKSKKQIE
jgi:DNA repair exonuclease SbcCD ATPase subunit